MNALTNIFIVSKYTFLDLLKSKILILIVLLGIALITIAYIASELTYGVPQKVALDFGLGTLTLALTGIAIFMGATLITKEVENRTLYMVLSRPVSREIFLFGKMVGLLELLSLGTLILGLLSVLMYWLLGGEIKVTIFQCVFLIFAEATLVMVLSIFFSLVTNSVASVVYTLALYLAGHAIGEVQTFSYVVARPGLAKFINFYSLVFPNFSKINLKDYVLYEATLPQDYIQNACFYSITYSLSLLFIIIVLFRKKELD
ncbi:MAG: ABC transporter permease subunit [Bdellovibrio sp.]|nr:ABC transporter permease subunit [Bdellovibrio sp.]